jgi:hypothetical protein
LRSMQRVYVYAGSGDDERECLDTRWSLNGSREGSWNKMGSSRAPRRQRVATMRSRKARIPLGVQVHLERWDDTVLLVDFDGGEHGGGL